MKLGRGGTHIEWYAASATFNSLFWVLSVKPLPPYLYACVTQRSPFCKDLSARPIFVSSEIQNKRPQIQLNMRNLSLIVLEDKAFKKKTDRSTLIFFLTLRQTNIFFKMSNDSDLYFYDVTKLLPKNSPFSLYQRNCRRHMYMYNSQMLVPPPHVKIHFVMLHNDPRTKAFEKQW